jgi:dienelactone hydrolase
MLDRSLEKVPGLAGASRGTTANGVPFVALPPEGGQATGVVVLWHGMDAPRTEEALAGAVPMFGLTAWRLYLGLPQSGRRALEGGFEEIMRRGTEDAVALLFEPTVTGALIELPGAFASLTEGLGIDPGLPLGVFGFSIGGATALLAVSQQLLPFKAAMAFGGTPDIKALVDANAPFFGITYEWNEQRRALADSLSASLRARELAQTGVPILLAVGADDALPVRQMADQLSTEMHRAGGSAEVVVLPNVAHGFVDEPGVEAVPQGPAARAIDRLATDWFRRHL